MLNIFTIFNIFFFQRGNIVNILKNLLRQLIIRFTRSLNLCMCRLSFFTQNLMQNIFSINFLLLPTCLLLQLLTILLIMVKRLKQLTRLYRIKRMLRNNLLLMLTNSLLNNSLRLLLLWEGLSWETLADYWFLGFLVSIIV